MDANSFENSVDRILPVNVVRLAGIVICGTLDHLRAGQNSAINNQRINGCNR